MEIIKIISFVAPVGKNVENKATIKTPGTEIHNGTALYNLISKLFNKSRKECNIPILFYPKKDGENYIKKNEVRDLIIKAIKRKSISNCKEITRRLSLCTNNISKMGLLFFIFGKDKNKKILLVSRFPAEQGITISELEDSLSVELVEDVFMKNRTAYKAALYEGESFDSDFWEGSAVDKQINKGSKNIKELSDYWIKDFLKSQFRITPRYGSNLLAKTFQKAIKNTKDVLIKDEIISASKLIKNKNNQAISFNSIARQYSLSDNAKKMVYSALDNDSIKDFNFLFDYTEFSKVIKYKVIYLDNEAILSAPFGKFDSIWESKKSSDKYTFMTKGRINNAIFKSRI